MRFARKLRFELRQFLHREILKKYVSGSERPERPERKESERSENATTIMIYLRLNKILQTGHRNFSVALFKWSVSRELSICYVHTYDYMMHSTFHSSTRRDSALVQIHSLLENAFVNVSWYFQNVTDLSNEVLLVHG
jgi:hypothetical protein